MATSKNDAGEGLSGVSVTIDGQTVVRTNAAGGWSAAVEDGPHRISAHGGQFSGVSTVNATVAGDNVQVDFISGRVAGQVTFAEVYGTNVARPIDVNASGDDSALDALIIVNHIGVTQSGGQRLYDTPVYLDVSGDGNVTTVDALQVINGLSRQAIAETENVAASLDWLSTGIAQDRQQPDNARSTQIQEDVESALVLHEYRAQDQTHRSDNQIRVDVIDNSSGDDASLDSLDAESVDHLMSKRSIDLQEWGT